MDAVILSYALDTNGQNARFVEAARKHGRDEAVLNALAIGNQDPAGVLTRYKELAEKGDEIRIRSAHRSNAYFDFPMDIVWTRKTEREIKELAEAADVIHLNNSIMAYNHFRLNRKPALIHHHGSLFRNNVDSMLKLAKHHRIQQAVSTIDLQKPAPDLLPWLPTAYDVDALQALAKEHRREPDGRVRIVHAPTNRELKHTGIFLEAVRQLQEEGLPVDLDIVEGKTWAECMARKAQADIVYDQIMYGYGCNAVEAWGMGIPVVAGAQDPWVLERMKELWGELPFWVADEHTLLPRLRRLVNVRTERERFAKRGLEHVRKYHDEKPALAKLAELYGKAIAMRRVERIPGKAPAKVTFVKTTSRKVYDDEGNPLPFVDGKLETDDPIIINRARYFASKKGAFGVEEVA